MPTAYLFSSVSLLQGHEREGYGLSWSPFEENKLVSVSLAWPSLLYAIILSVCTMFVVLVC